MIHDKAPDEIKKTADEILTEVAVHNKKPEKSESLGSSYSLGIKIAIEFFSMVMVAGVMGYFIDGFLQTRPIFMIIMGFFGVAAGIYKIYANNKI